MLIAPNDLCGELFSGIRRIQSFSVLLAHLSETLSE
jgi:hypothetical protein